MPVLRALWLQVYLADDLHQGSEAMLLLCEQLRITVRRRDARHARMLLPRLLPEVRLLPQAGRPHGQANDPHHCARVGRCESSGLERSVDDDGVDAFSEGRFAQIWHGYRGITTTPNKSVCANA